MRGTAKERRGRCCYQQGRQRWIAAVEGVEQGVLVHNLALQNGVRIRIRYLQF